MVCWMRCSTSASNLARVSFMVKCLGPEASAVMNGRLISVCVVDDSSIFAFSADSLSRCSASLSRRRSMPCSFWNSSARRSEEHTSELQSPDHLVCRLLLEKKKVQYQPNIFTTRSHKI